MCARRIFYGRTIYNEDFLQNFFITCFNLCDIIINNKAIRNKKIDFTVLLIILGVFCTNQRI